MAADSAASIDVVENLNSRSVWVSPGKGRSAYQAIYSLIQYEQLGKPSSKDSFKLKVDVCK